MRPGKLIALVGAAIAASSSLLLGAGSAASAAAAPSVPTFHLGFAPGSGCEGDATLYEYRDAFGNAFVTVHLDSDPCGLGVEGIIEGPAGSPFEAGGDVHFSGDNSTTNVIPGNPGNHHGLRWFPASCATTCGWTYVWAD
jgi:hypothetical protein